ncbi:uncharacterized protein LOC144914767 [Branchiostoma floridae x Branchiostoma belcheri]
MPVTRRYLLTLFAAAMGGMYFATLLYIFPKVFKDEDSSPLPRREGQSSHLSVVRKVYLQDDSPGKSTMTPMRRPDESTGHSTQLSISSPSFKVFVYDLPPEFNSDLVHCIQVKNRCYQLQDYGMGLEFARYGNVSFRSTHMFALEVILHRKILSSSYRTLDPEKADVFYVPYYPALAAACEPMNVIDNPVLDRELWQFLKVNYPYFEQGKPHIMALGRIEREHADVTGGILKTTESRSVTFVGIEHESDPKTLRYIRRNGLSMVVAPYPSFGHIISNNNDFGVQSKHDKTSDMPRDVFVLFAGSRRMSHDIRRILSRQLLPTSEKYSPSSSPHNKQNVWFITQECRDRSWQGDLVEWMHHSVFCLQPPGDSPTRKSFYDAVQCGCIPVIFKLDYKPVYPFDDVLDYTKFTVKITDEDFFQGKRSISDILRDIPEAQITAKQGELRQVAPLMQYSYPPLPETKDAFDMVMNEIGRTRVGKNHVRRRFGSKVRKVVGRGAGGWVVE